MSKNEIFELYGKVQKGDKQAKQEMVALYKKEFPRKNIYYKDLNISKSEMHMIYSHLYRMANK